MKLTKKQTTQIDRELLAWFARKGYTTAHRYITLADESTPLQLYHAVTRAVFGDTAIGYVRCLAIAQVCPPCYANTLPDHVGQDRYIAIAAAGLSARLAKLLERE